MEDAAGAGDAAGGEDAAAGAGDAAGESAPRKHKKHKSEKKSKKEKKHKKQRKASGDADRDDGSEGDAAAAGEDASSSSSSSSSSDEGEEDDSQAELRDADEERRRARKREKKEKKREKKEKKEKKKAAAAAGSDKRKRRERVSKFLDVEAEVSSDEEVSGDEADGADEDGFLADLVVPDDEVNAEIARNAAAARRSEKRKRPRRIVDDDLDEEDLNLVRENLGIATRANIDEDVDRDEDDDERGGERKRLKKGAAREDDINFERLAREKRERERKQRERARQPGGLDDFDDDDGFIASEDDGENMGAGGSARRARPQDDDDLDNFVEDDTKRAGGAGAGGAGAAGALSSETRERLRDLFGSVTTFFQGKRAGKGAAADDEDGAWGEEDNAAEDEAADSDESEAEQRRLAEQKRRARASARATATTERGSRQRAVRDADIPERLYERHQRRMHNLAGLSEDARELERLEEAQWCFQQLFKDPNSPFFSAPAQPQYGYAAAPAAKHADALVPTIQLVLTQLQDDHLEIGYIATYHRDTWGGRLMRPEQRLSEEELLKLDELDERWTEIGRRRKKLTTLVDAYTASSQIQNLHLSDAASGNAYLSYATPSASALAAWRSLLSSSELSGTTELDDVQDALKVLGLVEQCKKRQAAKHRREQREYERQARRQQKEAARHERAEQRKRAAEERARLRAELSNSFEAGAAAAAAGLDEQLQQQEEEEVKEEESAEEPSEPELPEDDADMEDAQGATGIRARANRGQFAVLSKCWSINGVPALAASLGITPSQLAENASMNYKRYESRDGPWNVDFLVEDAVRHGQVRDVDEALLCARRYAAFLLASNPLLRREVRKHYLEHGLVSTVPTAKGARELDETHEYASVRRIVQKPVARMREHPAQFLLMHQAEAEGFIRIELSLPASKDAVNRLQSLAMEEPEKDDLTAVLCELYLTNNTSPDGLKWNVQRRMVIHDAMQTHLVPLCHAHVRSTLLRHAQDFVAARIGKQLNERLTVSGYKPKEGLYSSVDDDAAASAGGKRKRKKGVNDNWRIFSMVVGDAHSPTHLAVLNRYGQLVDHLCLHHIKSTASARGRNDQPLNESERLQYARKKEDSKRLQELVKTHDPRLVLLDAASLDARHLKDDLRTRLLMDRPEIDIEFADPSLSRIYMNSARAELEFKEHPRALRQAISLGRQALDPVAEFAGVFSGPMDASQWTDSANTSAQLMNAIRAGRNEDDALRKDVVAAATNALTNDLLALTLHPLQRMLPQRTVLSALQRTLVRVVNYVGVDINRVQQRPWLAGTLQFLTGLGPLKAKMLLDHAKKRGFIASRAELLSKEALAQPQTVKTEDGLVVIKEEKPSVAAPSAVGSGGGLFGPCVWRNCCGYLVIRANAAMESLSSVSAHPLDETRIHPDAYAETIVVVHSALDIDEEEMVKEIEEDVKKQMRKAAREHHDDEDEDEAVDDDEMTDDARAKKKSKLASRESDIRARLEHEAHVKQVLQAMSPQGVKLVTGLDLDGYVEEMQKSHDPATGPYVPHAETVDAIVRELCEPFADYKGILKPFRAPTSTQLFYLLTGESPRTLREGMMVQAVVNGLHPSGKGAYLRLDSGIRGFLSLRNVSDSAPQGSRSMDPSDQERETNDNVVWLKARLQPGLTLTTRILRLEHDKFMVELSSKSSDLNQHTWEAGAEDRQRRERMLQEKWGRAPPPADASDVDKDIYFSDPYLFVGTHPDDVALLKADSGPVKKAARFRQRNITHTLFRNYSREEAVAFLRERAVGDVVVRPSSLGTNHLTLTWKVSNEEVSDPLAGPDAPPEKGIYFHVDIHEHDKPNELEVGQRLTIGQPGGAGAGGEYSFEDLDEIVARFVQPMLAQVNQLTNHKNFRYGGDAEIQQILLAEKSQDRSKIPYVLHFATSAARAGCFQFSFLPNSTVKSSTIAVIPEGFKYHGHKYSSLPRLLDAIKAEMSGRVGVAPPAGSQRAQAKAAADTAGRDRKPVSVPPYAGAAQTQSRPPYASDSRPPAASVPPYAAAAPSQPPYAAPAQPQPPYYGAQQQPPPQSMPPYAGASMPPYGAPQQQPPYGAPGGYAAAPQQPSYGGYPQSGVPQPRFQPAPQQQMPMPMPPTQQPRQLRFDAPAPPPQQPQAAAPAAAATSGYVHPSRLGIVAHSQPQQQQAPPQQQQQAPYDAQGYYQQQQQQQQSAQPRQSRWSNARNDDMQM